MHRRTVLLIGLMVMGRTAAQAPTDPSIVGRWQGDARLFHEKTRTRTGAIRAELVITADGALAGRVGHAVIPATSPKSRSAGRLVYEVRLSGVVHEHVGAALDHLVILVTVKPGALLDADFHLKKRFAFDPGMLVGHFDVQKLE